MAVPTASVSPSLPAANDTYLCPLPQSWYPADSPCAAIKGPVGGAPQESWGGPSADQLSNAGSAMAGVLKTVYWTGVILMVLYLGEKVFASYVNLRAVTKA